MTRQKAMQLRKLIETLSTGMDDGTALTGIELFPAWRPDVAYSIGDRVQYNNTLYKCLQAHTSQTGREPGNAPSLFAQVLTSEDGTPLPWQQPDSANSYMAGDRVTHNGKTWESTIDSNVWEPGVYGWTEIG